MFNLAFSYHFLKRCFLIIVVNLWYVCIKKLARYYNNLDYFWIFISEYYALYLMKQFVFLKDCEK
ncbi:hypothetical protein A1OE_1185 [Candidatus Endolissoclinum faulkneri L2]|uniref:Uncharacterized protein n=1 Tax=Candidatus Endolissoclinum faulkneri L2 TaxID=1193729 RepID=K7Z5M5_9PROT|nr:hypothetical protein A1OE_1185 [Candidatus Endolissoclinum faulkneri L2]